MWQLIDADGEQHSPPYSELQTSIHTRLEPEVFANFAVRNMGYVAVNTKARSIEIMLNPHLLAPLAHGALLYLLADSTMSRVAIRWYLTTWVHEIAGPAQAAISRISTEVARLQNEDAARLQRRTLPMIEIADRHSLRLLARDLRGALINTKLRRTINDALDGKYAVIDLASEHDVGIPMLSAVGDAMTLSTWANAVGLPARVARHPDRRYGAWVCAHYLEVLQHGRAACDMIRADLVWPGLGRMSHDYLRLLLPVSPSRILCASITHNTSTVARHRG